MWSSESACLSKRATSFEVRGIQGYESDVNIVISFKVAYQVSKNVLQYDQLQKKEMPPFSVREAIV